MNPARLQVSDRLAAGMVASAVVLWVAQTPTTAATASAGLWKALLLAGALVVVELNPLSMWLRGESQHITLTGLVSLLGIVFVGPLPTLALHVASGLACSRAIWGSGQRTRYNLALRGLETWVLAAIYGAVIGSDGVLSTRAALAIALSIGAMEIFSAAMVMLVIRLTVGPLQAEALRYFTLAIGINISMTVAAGVVAERLLHIDVSSAVAFVMVLALLVVTNRSRHVLVNRLRSVSDLYDFIGNLEGIRSLDAGMTIVLRESVGVMSAGSSSVVLTDGTKARRFRLDAHDELLADDVDVVAAQELAAAVGKGKVVAFGAPRPCAEITGGPGEGMLLVCFTNGEVQGVLVFEGRDQKRPKYDEEDLALANALAQHSGKALVTARLVDTLRARTRELEQSALHDHHTGLRNVAGLRDTIGLLQNGAVAVVDLLDFEMIETAFGDEVAEDVAASTAERLGELAVTRGFEIGRVAPGRFAVVMPGATDRLLAREALIEIRERLEGPIFRAHLRLELRFSIGAAMVNRPQVGDDIGELLRQATNALVEGRETRAEASWFRPELDDAATERIELASDLRRAIDEGGLSLAYQPKVDIESGRIVGVEALARWAHPVRGYVSPAVFIDIAERTGLIRSLTEWVVATAVQQAADWHRAGHDLSMAINLSAVTMDDPALARAIIQRSRLSGLPANKVTCEITESHVMGDLERGSGVLALLDAAGMRLSVDDFGTGYSSLAQLKSLPVDELKIDRAFITHLATDPRDHAITASVVSMAASLGLHVVAEGIEDRESLDMLRALGCHTAQGFFLHRPLPAAEIDDLLAAGAGIPIEEAKPGLPMGTHPR